MSDTYHFVELSPLPQVVHLTAKCGPKKNLIMVNFYEKTRFLTFAEALELASALIACAWDQDTETMKAVMQAPDAKMWLESVRADA